jgi:hypothetical protein
MAGHPSPIGTNIIIKERLWSEVCPSKLVAWQRVVGQRQMSAVILIGIFQNPYVGQ